MTAEAFGAVLRDRCGVKENDHVLAAVSGGADSVALLCLLCQVRERMGLRVSVAHIEHGIRGEESQQDMEFVRALCAQKSVAFYAKRVDAPAFARENGCGVEDAARRLRYAFLEETREEIGADVIAAAHHGGDQAETVLLHAARGSDVRGLCAMRARRGRIIRPLLETDAKALRAYLGEIGQNWREDATNEDTDFARNRIRHRVLPELERACPGAGNAISRLAAAAQRDEDFFSRQLDALGLEIIELVNGAAVDVSRMRELHEALLSRALVRVFDAAGVSPGRWAVDKIVRALRQEEPAFAVGIGAMAQARLSGRYFCVTRPYEEIADTPLAPDGETMTPFGAFFVRDAADGETGDGRHSQVIPAHLLSDAVISSRREGDHMVPFGQHAPVKVKKLLIDGGVERAMRSSVPVLRRGGDVLWLVGLRPSQSCRAQAGQQHKMIVFRGQWP